MGSMYGLVIISSRILHRILQSWEIRNNKIFCSIIMTNKLRNSFQFDLLFALHVSIDNQSIFLSSFPIIFINSRLNTTFFLDVQTRMLTSFDWNKTFSSIDISTNYKCWENSFTTNNKDRTWSSDIVSDWTMIDSIFDCRDTQDMYISRRISNSRGLVITNLFHM